MKFSEIIEALEQGKVVRRAGWNGKSIVVFKQVPAKIGAATIPNMQSLPADAKEVILRTAGHIDYMNQCLLYNTSTGEANSWVPSSSDTFADDWAVVDI